MEGVDARLCSFVNPEFGKGLLKSIVIDRLDVMIVLLGTRTITSLSVSVINVYCYIERSSEFFNTITAVAVR